jgi:hypothetical protein
MSTERADTQPLSLKFYGPAQRKYGEVAEISPDKIGYIYVSERGPRAFVVDDEMEFIIQSGGTLEEMASRYPGFVRLTFVEGEEVLVNPRHVAKVESVEDLYGPGALGAYLAPGMFVAIRGNLDEVERALLPVTVGQPSIPTHS